MKWLVHNIVCIQIICLTNILFLENTHFRLTLPRRRSPPAVVPIVEPEQIKRSIKSVQNAPAEIVIASAANTIELRVQRCNLAFYAAIT